MKVLKKSSFKHISYSSGGGRNQTFIKAVTHMIWYFSKITFCVFACKWQDYLSLLHEFRRKRIFVKLALPVFTILRKVEENHRIHLCLSAINQTMTICVTNFQTCEIVFIPLSIVWMIPCVHAIFYRKQYLYLLECVQILAKKNYTMFLLLLFALLIFKSVVSQQLEGLPPESSYATKIQHTIINWFHI